MNIAIFTDSYYPRINGVTFSVNTYATSLSKLGNKVCVVCPDYSKKQQKDSYYDEFSMDNKSNFQIIRIPSIGLVWSKEDRGARLDQWKYIKKQMDIFKPDVVHVNTEFCAGYYGAIYARHRHIPYVSTFHTMWEDYLENYLKLIPSFASRKVGKELIKFYLKYVSLIITPTEEMANVIRSYGTDKKIEVMPTGIDLQTLNYKKNYSVVYFNKLHKLLPIIRKKHILLYVGRIVKEKNLDFLFDVLAEVRKSVKDTALIFVGDGPEKNALEQKASKLPFSWNIVFAGYRKREELAYFYHLADVFVFPSKTETQGLVTIESMLCGTPVVAIGEMGTVNVMQGDNGGFMVKDDVNEFSSKVVELLTNKELHKKKSEEAKEWGKQWSVEGLTPKLISYYQEAIDNYKKEESK
ncbi:MAG: glycosyltransferase [Treponema sp.]